MPANLSIKNVPDEVMSGLRNRAANNQRSFQAELLEILKQAAKDQVEISIDGLLERAQRKRPVFDDAATNVRAAQEAERVKLAQRFDDLLGRPGDSQS
jgi:plasmid stability protein